MPVFEDVRSFLHDVSSFSCQHAANPIAPIRLTVYDWLPSYNREMLLKDLIAGLTVFVFLVPQGMAYSILAGMPPVYGLYSATFPLYVYALFGTSRQLAIGPMAITSLLLGVTSQQFGYSDGSPEYIRLVTSITFLVGSITFFLGLFRLGSLSNVISQSVLTGFLTASALVIALSQLKYIFGISVPRFQYSHQIILYLLTHLGESDWAAVVLGLLTLCMLIGVREWKKRNKSPPPASSSVLQRYSYQCLSVLSVLSNFLTIIIGAAIAKMMISGGIHIKIIGDVPSGMLPPSLNLIGDLNSFMGLIPSALAIAFVAFAGNYAVAMKYGQLNNHSIDATQELVGTGLAVLVGVFFNGFVVAGGLARSAVNAESGAQTQLSSCFTATFMIIALLSLTSYFYYIPMTVLAAVIEVSIISMIDFQSMIKAYKVDRRDCFVMIITFVFTFFLGIIEGLFVGICISVAMVMRTTAFPAILILGKLPSYSPSSGLVGEGDGSSYYRNVERFPEAEQIPGYSVIRMDASMYFANCSHFKSFILKVAKGQHPSVKTKPPHTIIIDASAWIDIDLTGIQTLYELREELSKKYHITLLIACVKGVIRDRLKENHFVDEQTSLNSFYYMTIDDAIYRKRHLLSVSSSQPRRESGNAEERKMELISSLEEVQNPLSSDIDEAQDVLKTTPNKVPFLQKSCANEKYSSLATDDYDNV
jgi:SulP family sulfate permease